MFGTPRLLMGIHPDGFCWRLSLVGGLTTPEVLMTYSKQRWSARCPATSTSCCAPGSAGAGYRGSRRPVVLNSWEACYFDFDEEKLIDIGRCAAGLGWFVGGGRRLVRPPGRRHHLPGGLVY